LDLVWEAGFGQALATPGSYEGLYTLILSSMTHTPRVLRGKGKRQQPAEARAGVTLLLNNACKTHIEANNAVDKNPTIPNVHTGTSPCVPFDLPSNVDRQMQPCYLSDTPRQSSIHPKIHKCGRMLPSLQSPSYGDPLCMQGLKYCRINIVVQCKEMLVTIARSTKLRPYCWDVPPYFKHVVYEV
jgi:hypothetical protein